MKKMSLKARMILAVCSVVLVSYVISIGYIEIKASNMTRMEAQDKSIETAKKYGGEVAHTINHSMDSARTIAQVFEGLKKEEIPPNRAYLNDILKNVLKENPEFTSVGCCFEPNAFDAKDDEFINKPGYDSTGRFIPYWTRSNGKIEVEPLNGYENSEWYLLPKKTGKELFTNPYLYSSSNGEVLMATAVVPIIDQGSFIGAVAIDITLDKFQDQISKIRPFGVGYSGLVANNGFIVAHTHESKIGKNVSDFDYGEHLSGLKSSIEKGSLYKIEKIKNHKGVKTFQAYVPIQIGKSENPWSIGVIVPYSKILEGANSLRNTSIILGIVGILSLFLVVWVVSERIVIRPINKVTANLKDIARGEGDLTKRLDIKRNDEIGSLAHWFNSFMDKLQPMIKEISGNADTISSTSTDILSLTEKITENSGETMESSKRVNAETEDLKNNMTSVASAMEQAAANVGTVAAAAEEMNSTIREIAENTEKTHTITETASERADETTKSMEVLDLAAKEISKITDTISDISEQTNLLALNATIEAARAGDAGKGFAVVASEIKELANQTSTATGEINEKISRVQEASNKGIELITEIAGIIHEVDGSVSSIAAAVEQQSAATEEVAINANQVSEGIQDVNSNIAEVNSSTENIAQDVESVHVAVNGIYSASVEARNSSDEQNHVSERLNVLTGGFKVGEKLFDIGKVKMAHLIWVTIVDEVLGGRRKMTADEVVSHRECEFGKWYFGEGQRFKDIPIFKELGVFHERVHTIVKEIIGFYNNGEKSKAESLLKEFTDVRRKLFDCLDELYKE